MSQQQKQHENQEQDMQVTILDAKPAARTGLVQSAKDFIGNAFGGGKNQDLPQLIEEFTSEMTLVIEGISQDLDHVSKQTDLLSAAQVEGVEDLRRKLNDTQKDAREASRRMDDLAARLDKLEKDNKAEKEKKVKAGERVTGVLRQATWLAAIIAGAWVLVTIINLFK